MNDKPTLVIIGRAREERENTVGMLKRQLGLHQNEVPYMVIDGTSLPAALTPDDAVIAYFSSKQRFPSVFAECERRKLPLIVASSGIDIGPDVPEKVDFPVVMAPNLSEIVMLVFKAFEAIGPDLQRIGIKSYVAEGHQASKTSAPATAQKIAKYVGNPPESVGSIRNDPIARAILGIAEEKLGGFGAHFIAASRLGANLRVQFDTQGRDMYYSGLMALYRKIIATPGGLPAGISEAHKVLFG